VRDKKVYRLYENGQDVAQNYGKARELFQKAADAGRTNAMNNLGWHYQNGWGVAQDYDKARKWFQKAADADHSNAMNNLSWLYQNGWGVAQDHDKARKWFIRAAAYKEARREITCFQRLKADVSAGP
jgi:uncharacterized protein